MAALVNSALPFAVITLPFASAVALSLIPSWRIGTGVNAGAATLLFLLACALPWYAPSLPSAETHLVLLTSFVAMTTSWYGHRDVAMLLSARLLDRRRVRLYHVAYQALLGAIVLALLADRPALNWLALAIATAAAAAVTSIMRGPAARPAVSHLVTLCGVGLLLALFGLVLLSLSPALAAIFLVVGYGALAGLVPLHAWLPDAAAEAVPPGAIIMSTLMVNAPLLLLFRLRPTMPPGLLVAIGLASLLVGAAVLLLRPELRRAMALAGTAQLGMVVFAFGIGGPAASIAGWVQMTLLALLRASVLQCPGPEPAQRIAVLGVALLPLFALVLLGEPTAEVSVSLLLLLGAGALLTSWALLRLPSPLGPASDRIALIPVWLQLAIAALLAFAMPAPVTAWFHAMTAAG
jgi:hydrogenase-4 component F